MARDKEGEDCWHNREADKDNGVCLSLFILTKTVVAVLADPLFFSQHHLRAIHN